jgi:hypothetical protein
MSGMSGQAAKRSPLKRARRILQTLRPLKTPMISERVGEMDVIIAARFAMREGTRVESNALGSEE